MGSNPWTSVAHRARRTVATVWPLLVTIACLLLLSWWTIGLMSAGRAYVAGNSIWSRAQKDAVIHVLRYARSLDDADYQEFTQSIAVIDGDRRARLAMQRTPPDRAAARQGLLEGGNTPADIAGMIGLFTRYQRVSFMSAAISVWTEADALVLKLEAAGAAIRREVTSAERDPATLERLRAEVADINRRLTPLEKQFAEVLGNASRDIENLLFYLMLTAAGILVSLGLMMIHRVLSISDATRAERDALLGDVQLAFELTQSVNRAVVLDEVYEPAIDALLRALAVERASVLLFDPDGVMRFKAWRGLSDRYRQAVEGHSPWTPDEKNATPIVVEDTETDPSVTSYRARFFDEGIRAMAFIPLVDRGTLLGKFMVYAPQPRRFSTREIQLAQTVAAQVAASVSRARLFESERAYARQAEQLYEQEHRAVSMRDQFIAIASHELNTPLTVLKLNLQLVDRYRAQPQMFQGALDKLEGNIARLERLIVQLLDVSRVSGGKLVLERRPTDLGAVVQAVAQRTQPELERSGSVLALSIAEPLKGCWDPERIDQIATNLLQNAIKYGQGRTIAVRVERCGDTALLVVRDQGIGIAPEDQARVFERFERAVSPQHFGGFGLGLWIVRAVVEAHGGSISVVSTPGMGAEFRVTLPMAAATATSSATETQAAP